MWLLCLENTARFFFFFLIPGSSTPTLSCTHSLCVSLTEHEPIIIQSHRVWEWDVSHAPCTSVLAPMFCVVLCVGVPSSVKLLEHHCKEVFWISVYSPSTTLKPVLKSAPPPGNFQPKCTSQHVVWSSKPLFFNFCIIMTYLKLDSPSMLCIQPFLLNLQWAL